MPEEKAEGNRGLQDVHPRDLEDEMACATLRRASADRFLENCGFTTLGEGNAPLDRVMDLLEKLDLLDESGALLISAEATLRQNEKSDIYFLGLNPGGDASESHLLTDNFPTVYDSLSLSRMGVSGWDQDWSRKGASYKPGQAPIQKRFKHIARLLGLAYSEIFATNLVFARSSRFNQLQHIHDQINICLPAHRLMLDIVQPKRLWVMGNTDSAGDALKLHKDVVWQPAKYGSWSIGHGTVDFCGRTMTLCHTPHLTFWDAASDDKQELLDFAFGR